MRHLQITKKRSKDALGLTSENEVSEEYLHLLKDAGLGVTDCAVTLLRFSPDDLGQDSFWPGNGRAS